MRVHCLVTGPLRHRGVEAEGSWLFDTGAAASIMSEHIAGELGVSYGEGLNADGQPYLEGVAVEDQFTLTIGGIGGSKVVTGFFLDSLVIPTREGEMYDDARFDLNYLRAPVLVLDITVVDPLTEEVLTLDGVLGMNYFVASMFISETPGQLWGDTAVGAYDWLVFDEPSGVLGLELNELFELPDACHVADVNCDGVVGLVDLDILGSNFGLQVSSRGEGDLNGDGVVSLIDLDILGRYYGDVVAVPEPGVVAMLLAGGLVLMRRSVA